jgi:hypothetical protein
MFGAKADSRGEEIQSLAASPMAVPRGEGEWVAGR